MIAFPPTMIVFVPPPLGLTGRAAITDPISQVFPSWETFRDHLLSHGAGRLIPVQAKILDISFQV